MTYSKFLSLTGSTRILSGIIGILFLSPARPMAQACCADGYSIVQTFAGTGIPGYTGNGGPATSATFNQIFGICFDPSGNMYVCDLGNSVVRKISTTGVITTYAGNGTPGNSGDGGPATSAQIFQPSHVVTDAAGNLYFTDLRSEERRVGKEC